MVVCIMNKTMVCLHAYLLSIQSICSSIWYLKSCSLKRNKIIRISKIKECCQSQNIIVIIVENVTKHMHGKCKEIKTCVSKVPPKTNVNEFNVVPICIK